MKKPITCYLAFILLFAACKKEDAIVPVSSVSNSSNNSESQKASVTATAIGITPIKYAQQYAATVTRDQINYKYWQQQSGAIRRIAAYNQDSVIININNSNSDLSPAKFVTDTVEFKKELVDLWQKTHFKHIVFENENENTSYYNDSVSNYINEVTAGTNALAPFGVKMYNGGFILIRLWYYDKTKDEDFFNSCLSPGQQYRYKKGYYTQAIADEQRQIDAFKNLPGFTAFNIHNLYVSSESEFPGLYRMIDYLKKSTRLRVISNEAGYYVNNSLLINRLTQLAREEQFRWMIEYSGNGAGDVLNIPEPVYKASLQ